MNKRIDNNNDPFEPFNLNDFKKWMENQDDSRPRRGKIGTLVESKISVKKLMHKIDLQNGELEDVIKEFYDNGGIISEVNGNHFLIETTNGSFFIHRCFVEKN